MPHLKKKKKKINLMSNEALFCAGLASFPDLGVQLFVILEIDHLLKIHNQIISFSC